MVAAVRARAMPPLILVVDDEYDIRDLMAEALALEGYDVSTASDGKVALEQARANLAADVRPAVGRDDACVVNHLVGNRHVAR